MARICRRPRQFCKFTGCLFMEPCNILLNNFIKLILTIVSPYPGLWITFLNTSENYYQCIFHYIWYMEMYRCKVIHIILCTFILHSGYCIFCYSHVGQILSNFPASWTVSFAHECSFWLLNLSAYNVFPPFNKIWIKLCCLRFCVVVDEG